MENCVMSIFTNFSLLITTSLARNARNKAPDPSSIHDVASTSEMSNR